jgi:hypothetical protein
MAADIQITCINKTPRMDPHETIQYVGGVNPNGTRWKLSQPDAIAGIKRGEWTFYVHAGGCTAKVIIATSAAGNKYLKTVNDGLHPDNLLSLPERPGG